jgi:plasmid stabilization system protein ParE
MLANYQLEQTLKRDLRTVMTHYQEEVGPDLAARFHREFEEVAFQIEQNPRRFHIVSAVLRRSRAAQALR